ncbi:MAG: hypothetical protein JNJ90_07075 [Saprospiraceae bacterium]|jgi:hypothetical protein|nr:hypothetical protein [Saprospiraceae bacterium]
MKLESSVLKKITPAVILLAVLTTACTNVYFENPVPQRGERVRAAPSELTGLYLFEPGAGETLSEWEQLLRPCFRIEATDKGNLLVSTENRLHTRDVSKLKKALDTQKQEGKLLDYQMTESAITCTVQKEEEGRIWVEEQSVALIKSGSWYVVAQSAKPYWLFDFEAGRQLEYKTEKSTPANSDWFPDAGLTQADTASLVALQKAKTWYFNTRKGDEKAWSLVCVEQAADDVLVVKFSSLDNKAAFEERAAYYNAITPFRKESDTRYLINPTDAALEHLLQEEQLFETVRLRKIE